MELKILTNSHTTWFTSHATRQNISHIVDMFLFTCHLIFSQNNVFRSDGLFPVVPNCSSTLSSIIHHQLPTILLPGRDIAER